MYVLDDNGVKCECVITDKENDILKIKNIATIPEYQGKGYARALIAVSYTHLWRTDFSTPNDGVKPPSFGAAHNSTLSANVDAAHYCGSVPHQEIKGIQEQADVVVFAEGIEGKMCIRDRSCYLMLSTHR